MLEEFIQFPSSWVSSAHAPGKRSTFKCSWIAMSGIYHFMSGKNHGFTVFTDTSHVFTTWMDFFLHWALESLRCGAQRQIAQACFWPWQFLSQADAFPRNRKTTNHSKTISIDLIWFDCNIPIIHQNDVWCHSTKFWLTPVGSVNGGLTISGNRRGSNFRYS